MVRSVGTRGRTEFMVTRAVARWRDARPLGRRARVGVAIGVLVAGVPARAARGQEAPVSVWSAAAPTATQHLPPTAEADVALPSAIRPFAVGVRPVDVDTPTRGTSVGDTTADHKVKHILLGMAIGTASGAALGYFIGEVPCIFGRDTHEDELVGGCEWGAGVLMEYGAFLGWLIGGFVGAYAERAIPGHPDRRLRIGAVPAGPSGLAVTVSVR